MLLIIDNFDSFTYNLVQAFQTLGAKTLVLRNNTQSVEECLAISPSHLVISPGPGTPTQAGISKAIIPAFAGKIPILGVCLGHQCIGEVFGGKVVRAFRPMHGKVSMIEHDDQTIFSNVPQNFKATRYHSLVIERQSLPECLKMTAWTQEGEIMAVRHKNLPIEGVQFHPESVMTTSGMIILNNFLKIGTRS